MPCPLAKTNPFGSSPQTLTQWQNGKIYRRRFASITSQIFAAVLVPSNRSNS